MMKLKAKSTAIQSGQGDFKLQSKRRPALRTARVQSRSCSPAQSPSPTSIPPHSKVAFADFVHFSSDTRVSSPRQEKPKSMSSTPASSSHCHSSGDHSSNFVVNSDHHEMSRGKAKASSSQPCSKQVARSAQGHPSMPSPTERVPLAIPVIVTPQASCNQVPLTGSTPGTSHSPSLFHFPDFASSVVCHIQGEDVSEPVDRWKFCLVGYVAGKFPEYSAMQAFINRTW
ncbi:hypothetical protein NC653_002162 [Populus alba x Populus x berolinensis]|uniref:Uncharacterized protein n=2 Tax=Populus alba x Populus x berolinensis TaxID=444605 RepID=A0AAD6RMZ0_9ROSI|nr:hypothetical protein NC653_002162 [Populus alba x Populus x berolinensis]